MLSSQFILVSNICSRSFVLRLLSSHSVSITNTFSLSRSIWHSFWNSQRFWLLVWPTQSANSSPRIVRITGRDRSKARVSWTRKGRADTCIASLVWVSQLQLVNFHQIRKRVIDCYILAYLWKALYVRLFGPSTPSSAVLPVCLWEYIPTPYAWGRQEYRRQGETWSVNEAQVVPADQTKKRYAEIRFSIKNIWSSFLGEKRRNEQSAMRNLEYKHSDMAVVHLKTSDRALNDVSQIAREQILGSIVYTNVTRPGEMSE